MKRTPIATCLLAFLAAPAIGQPMPPMKLAPPTISVQNAKTVPLPTVAPPPVAIKAIPDVKVGTMPPPLGTVPAKGQLPLAVETAGKAPLMNPLIRDAAIDSQKIRQNIDVSTMLPNATTGKGGGAMNPVGGQRGQDFGVRGIEGRKQMGVLGDGEQDFGKPLDGLQGGAVKGAKYGDTYQGSRINRRTSGDSRDFRGDGKGNARADEPGSGRADGERTIIGSSPGMEDTGMTREEFTKTVGDMLRAEGGTPTGNGEADARELSYAQSVGQDGYKATKNMSQDDRNSHWSFQAAQQKIKTPRDDDMGSGNVRPMGRQDVLNTMRGIARISGGAGGSGDGRTDQQQGGGGNVVIPVQKADGAQREATTGTLNMDAVMRINTQINPGSGQ